MRRDALRGLGELANASAVPDLVALLPSAPPPVTAEIESELAAICRRAADVSPLTGALSESPPTVKVALLNALAAVGGSEALSSIERELDSGHQELQMAALRLLAEWADASPLGRLGQVALTSADGRARTLALRGVARLAPLAKDQPTAEVVETIRQTMTRAGPSEQRALLAALGEFVSPASLNIAAAYLADPGLAGEARTTVCRILDGLDRSHRAEARPVLAQLRSGTANAADAARLDGYELKFGNLPNLSAGATATNLDGLKPDGQGGPASAAIDGNENTYWDEEDNQPLYVLRIDLKQRSKIATLRIVGWQQHNYAPRDFEIFGDGTPLKQIAGAQYTNNAFRVELPGAICRSLELRISGFYGASPAIRELDIYGEPVEQ